MSLFKQLFQAKKKIDASEETLSYSVCKKHSDAIVLFIDHCPICVLGIQAKPMPRPQTLSVPTPVDKPQEIPQIITQEIPQTIENHLQIKVVQRKIKPMKPSVSRKKKMRDTIKKSSNT